MKQRNLYPAKLARGRTVSVRPWADVRAWWVAAWRQARGADDLWDAPLVILDEPTAALDAKAEHQLFGKIGELFADRSVLLISHRFSTVRAADRIYVLRKGEVVEAGTHELLMAAAGTYAEMFTLQATPYK